MLLTRMLLLIRMLIRILSYPVFSFSALHLLSVTAGSLLSNCMRAYRIAGMACCPGTSAAA
jgi:hypothetical protein